MLIWMQLKLHFCRYLTAAVTKPAPLVLFADPQKAITRSGYISDSKYGVPRATNKNKKKKLATDGKQNNCMSVKIHAFGM
jgi:hypothetical protein